jgi:hypothetical protein
MSESAKVSKSSKSTKKSQPVEEAKVAEPVQPVIEETKSKKSKKQTTEQSAAVVKAPVVAPVAEAGNTTETQKSEKTKKSSKSEKSKKSTKTEKSKKSTKSEKSKKSTKSTKSAKSTKSTKSEGGEEAEDDKERYFHCVYKAKDGSVVRAGRYRGKKPKQAARKACSRIVDKNELQIGESLLFLIKECTRNSRKKMYAYTGSRVLLDKPVEVPITKKDGTKATLTYKHENSVKKAQLSDCGDLLNVNFEEEEAQVAVPEVKVVPKVKADTKEVKVEASKQESTKSTKTKKTDKVVEKVVEKAPEPVAEPVKETKKQKSKSK